MTNWRWGVEGTDAYDDLTANKVTCPLCGVWFHNDQLGRRIHDGYHERRGEPTGA